MSELLQSYADALKVLGGTEAVRKMLDFIKSDDEATLKEQIEICEIPAPGFAEAERAASVMARMKAYGLTDVTIDEVGNVVGVRPGRNPEAARIAIAAHLDTVFPAGTDVKVHKEGNRYCAPGISDDTRGLAALLSILRGLEGANIQTEGDILFVATVGEEGNGDIRGSKHLFFKSGIRVDGFIGIDSTNPERILEAATGSQRFRVAYDGPGGHSYHKFGKLPSANHALGRLVTKIADVEVPENPRTTFTVGVLKGGTTVNAIAAHAELELDMRSNDAAELEALVAKITPFFEEACKEENRRWKVEGTEVALKTTVTKIGDRPAGMQPATSPVLQACRAAQQVLGIETRMACASTDHNAPLSLGIPATTLGGGGVEANNHSLNEWYEPVNAWLGPQLAALSAVALVGVAGEAAPLLPRFKK